MVCVTRLLLDVLKPHHPNSLELASAVAAIGDGYRVGVRVTEVDEETETIVMEVAGEAIDFAAIEAAITRMGAALHSIDEVDVVGGVNQEALKE